MNTNRVALEPPELDLTPASRAFWLSARTRWSIEDHGDVTPPWPRARVRWRVPESVNVQGERWIQAGPLAWSGQVWRFQPHVLNDVSWQQVGRDAEALAAALERTLARGASGLPAARARHTIAALRRAPERLDALRTLALLDATRFMVVIELCSTDALFPGQRARGLVAYFVGDDGRVLPSSKSVYVAPDRALSADEVHVVGTALEISVHPVLIALAALNAGRAEVEDGKLRLST